MGVKRGGENIGKRGLALIEGAAVCKYCRHFNRQSSDSYNCKGRRVKGEGEVRRERKSLVRI